MILNNFMKKLDLSKMRQILNIPERRPTNYEVICRGLARGVIGDHAFEREHLARKHWLKTHCTGFYEIWGFWQGHLLIGRSFHFELYKDAVFFALTFDLEL